MTTNNDARPVTVSLTNKGVNTKDYWRVELRAFAKELEALKGEPWLWSPHTWRNDTRGNANWEATSCIAVDLDYADAWKVDPRGDKTPNHVPVPDDVRTRFNAALHALPRELAAGEVLAHHSPRGARMVLLLDAPITDLELYHRTATAVDTLISSWLDNAKLLADERKEQAGYGVDHNALIDVARVLWTPNATTVGPSGERNVRQGAFVVRGTPGALFSAAQLSSHAPAPLSATIDLTQKHAHHPLWDSIQTALVNHPGSELAPSGVRVCCPVHGPEKRASAIVFNSGVLKCLASGCEANTKAMPIEVWARTYGDELLGEELARIVSGPPAPTEQETQPTRLGDYWHTVAEWQQLDGSRWFDEPPPAREWLLTVPANALYPKRRVLPRGVVGMLAAGGSVGKTMALTQLAVSVATGRRWLANERGAHEDFPGFETPEGGGRVLLALGEEDAGEARRRLHGAVMGAGLTREEKVLVASRIVVAPLMGQAVQLIAPADKWGELPPQPTPFALELRTRLMESPEPWSLVVIDPLSRWAGPDTETDNAAATKFIQLLETFTKAPGTPTVLVAHHTTKTAKREGASDDTAARGASALSDGVRWHAHMLAKAHPEGMAGVGVPRMAELRVVKTNYGMPLDETLWLAREEGGWLRAATRKEKVAFVEADKAAKDVDKTSTRAPVGGLRVTR